MSDTTLPTEGVSEYALRLTVNGMERRTTVPVACMAADLLRDAGRRSEIQNLLATLSP